MNKLPLDRNIRIRAMLCIAANLMPLFVVYIPVMIMAPTLIPCLALGWVYPLIIWQTNRRRHSFVEECTREALNFTLSIDLYLIVFGSILIGSCFNNIYKGMSAFFLNMLIFTSFVIPLICIIYIGGIIFGIVNAAKGNVYKYPFSIRFFG